MWRLNTIWVLTKRELRLTLVGKGIYFAIMTSLLISSVILGNYLGAISRDGILITADPLSYPLFIATTVSAIYLALSSVTAIAREKDMQTLEVLFYGPVDHTSYILSKYLKEMLSYTFISLFLSSYFVAASIISKLELSIEFLWVLFLSFAICSCIIALGILISALTESVRTSVFLFIVILGAWMTLHVAHEVLIKMDAEQLSLPIVYLRSTLSVIVFWTKWLSPFHYLSEGMEAVSIGNSAKWSMCVIFPMIHSTIALFLSILVITKKGIRKTTGE